MNTLIEDKLRALFRHLYPHLSDEELKRAQVNFDRYLELVVRIAERELTQGKSKPALEDPEQLELF
ncbi:MAG TPA: hypothetical protein VFD92_15905 [Candidatus Binatia bacterium]|nr:hypothetical protein [Candidatus Binatia bacterium]